MRYVMGSPYNGEHNNNEYPFIHNLRTFSSKQEWKSILTDNSFQICEISSEVKLNF